MRVFWLLLLLPLGAWAADCGFSAAAEKLLIQLAERREEVPRDDYLDEARAAAERFRKAHPRDLFGQLTLLSLYRSKGHERVLRRYRGRKNGRADERLLEASSWIGSDTPKALELLRQLRRDHPDYPYVDLLLGEIQAYPNFVQSSPPGEAALRFVVYCPIYLPGYAPLRLQGDAQQVKLAATALRKALEGRGDALAQEYWPLLRSWEKLPPEERPQDTGIGRSAQERIAEWQRNPKGQERLAFAREMRRIFPGEYRAEVFYFAALAQAPATTREELRAAAKALRAAFERKPRRMPEAGPSLSIARAYVARGIELGQVEKLLRQAAGDLALMPRWPEQDLGEPADAAQRNARFLAEGHFEIARVRMDYALRKQDWKQAEDSLRQQREAMADWLKTEPGSAPRRSMERLLLAHEEGLRQAREPEWVLRVGAKLPPIASVDREGRAWTLAEVAGKTVIFNVWATWCEACRKELPEIEKLAEELAGDPNVVVVTLNADEDPQVVAPFLAQYGWRFPVLLAHSYIKRVAPELGIPRTWIVDGKGVLRYEQIGVREEKTWREELRERAQKIARP